jgi:hypothetical protein
MSRKSRSRRPSTSTSDNTDSDSVGTPGFSPGVVASAVLLGILTLFKGSAALVISVAFAIYAAANSSDSIRIRK